MADVGRGCERLRHDLENPCTFVDAESRELYTRHAADRRASATREQEAFHQNPRHIPRHDPVKPYRAGAAATSVALRLEA